MIKRPRWQRGQFLVLFALTVLTLLGIVGLGVDGARLYFHWTNVSRSIDAACLAVSAQINNLSESQIPLTAKKVAEFNLQKQGVDISKFVLETVVERNPASINLIKAKLTGTLQDVPSVLMKLIPGQSKSNVTGNAVCPTCYNNTTVFSLAPTDFYNLNIECQKTCNYHNGQPQFRIPGTETCCDSTFQVQMGDPVGSCMCAGTAALGPATGYCDPHGGNPGPINPSDPGISGPIWYDRTLMNEHVEKCNAECQARGYTHAAVAVNPNCDEETGPTCGMCHCLNQNPCTPDCNPILCPLTCGPKCGDGICDPMEICNCLPDCGPCPSSTPSPSPCPSDAPCTHAGSCGFEPVGTCFLGPAVHNGVCCKVGSPSPPPPCAHCCAPGMCPTTPAFGMCAGGLTCCPVPCGVTPSPTPTPPPPCPACCPIGQGCSINPSTGFPDTNPGTCAMPAMNTCCNSCASPSPSPSPTTCASNMDCSPGNCCNTTISQCEPCTNCTWPNTCRTDCGPSGVGNCFYGPAMSGKCCPSPSPSPTSCTTHSQCNPGECCNSNTCGPCTFCAWPNTCRTDCGAAGVGDCFIGPAMGYGKCCSSPSPSPTSSPTPCGTPGNICSGGQVCCNGTTCMMPPCPPSPTPTPSTSPSPATCVTNANCALGSCCVASVCGLCPTPTPSSPGSCMTDTDCAAGGCCLAHMCGPCPPTSPTPPPPCPGTCCPFIAGGGTSCENSATGPANACAPPHVCCLGDCIDCMPPPYPNPIGAAPRCPMDYGWTTPSYPCAMVDAVETCVQDACVDCNACGAPNESTCNYPPLPPESGRWQCTEPDGTIGCRSTRWYNTWTSNPGCAPQPCGNQWIAAGGS